MAQFIYGRGNLFLYNADRNTLEKYSIDLSVEAANMYYYKNSLVIVGGYIDRNHTNETITAIYRIDLSQLARTKYMKMEVSQP